MGYETYFSIVGGTGQLGLSRLEGADVRTLRRSGSDLRTERCTDPIVVTGSAPNLERMALERKGGEVRR